jgi:hypothetical protein
MNITHAESGVLAEAVRHRVAFVVERRERMEKAGIKATTCSRWRRRLRARSAGFGWRSAIRAAEVASARRRGVR